MKKFRTASGSEYTVDEEAKQWSRPPNPNSPFVRTQGGSFLKHSPILLGQSVTFICPPIDEESDLRLIVTTHVVEIDYDYNPQERTIS